MAINWGTAAMAFGSGVMDGNEKIRQENLKIHSEKLAAKRNAVIAMKKSKYEYDLTKYEGNKKKHDALSSVSANMNAGKFDLKSGDEGYDANETKRNTMALGEAYLNAKHGIDYVAKLKASKMGAEEDATQWQKFLQQEGNNPDLQKAIGNIDFKSRDIMESNYLESIQNIEDKYAAQLKNAKDDSPLVNAILGKKKEEIANLNADMEQDSKDIKTIDSATESITKKGDGETITETVDTEETITEGKKVSYFDSTISTHIPKSYKTDFNTKITDAKKIDYSAKEWQKKISDTVLTVIPNAKVKDFFEVDKDNNTITAKPSIINADVTIQSLMNNSLDDLNVQSEYKKTGNNKSRIDFNTNKRFQLAKGHIEDYGTWAADGKVLNGGTIKNLFTAKTTALIVPANSIINLNNNNLKGYDIIIPKDIRGGANGVGMVYQKFIKDKATARMNDENIGGTLEANINFLQRELENDNNGNNQLTKDARDYIANALTKSGYTVNKLGATKVDTTDEKKSTMEIKQEELSSGSTTKPNMISIDGNSYDLNNKAIVEELKKSKQGLDIINSKAPQLLNTTEADKITGSISGDGSVAEQVADVTNKKKITPVNIGDESGKNYFETLSSIRAILPNDMSGAEIKRKYNIDFPINNKTIYKPNR